jgi:Na+-translocating ferredoxin:NAD+ oxidoreductase subunit D
MTENIKLTISTPPHILNQETSKSIIWTIVIFLLPVTIFGIFSFGLTTLIILSSSITSSLLCEAIILKIRHKSISLDDGTAFLTGLIIGLCMPPTVPFFIPVISSLFAIGVVKHAFGGFGQNIFNPAMAGIAFALISWNKEMNVFTVPFIMDTITSATPLGIVKSAIADNFGTGHISSVISSAISGPMDFIPDSNYFKLFFGFKSGCIGEISIFLILMSSIYLIYRKIIQLEISFFYIVTVLVLVWIFDGLKYDNGFFHGDILFHFLSGGLVFGALFCATDNVTTPVTTPGRIIFGTGCGIITAVIRMFGSLPEGVAFSILFMNMLTPAIDKYIITKPLGMIKKNK